MPRKVYADNLRILDQIARSATDAGGSLTACRRSPYGSNCRRPRRSDLAIYVRPLECAAAGAVGDHGSCRRKAAWGMMIDLSNRTVCWR